MEPIEEYLAKVDKAKDALQIVEDEISRLVRAAAHFQSGGWKSALWPSRGPISMEHARVIGQSSQTPLRDWPLLADINTKVAAYFEAIRAAEQALQNVPENRRLQLAKPPY
jgi:hypothetical protein